MSDPILDKVIAKDDNVIHVDFGEEGAMIGAPDWAIEYNLEWLYESAQKAKRRQEILRATGLTTEDHAQGTGPERKG